MTATEAGRATVAPERAAELLHGMLRIRRFEEKAAELYSLAKIRGFLHLYIGEEAVAVGAFPSLREEDRIVATYREHGHALTRGLPMGALMAEMFGKTSGCSGGRGGSMHFFDASRRFYGGYAIVGGGLPVAVGLALADAMQGNPVVTACFFGDGAVVEGEFHESMNLAALWKLPVLFLYENNLYAMGTAIERSQAQLDMELRARGYGVPATVADGMDVLAVEAAVRAAVEAVRGGGGPRLVELKTYRFRAHSLSDADLYRSKEEVEHWRATRDPIDLFVAQQGIDAETVARLDATVTAELDEAIAFAEAGEWEPVEGLEDHVYTPAAP
ncbi:MAG TPA: pyruvate dehydrogenase (acetyl-transferring) E1 component subunit alpha [Gaiellaceae bacterium]|nr:pyruvate dehydrogenase (acetyl-transferring) E1 component subunit alpha [Gaiellaceae bacterium]